jgi:Na+-driven multidrug efflux pump
VRVLAISLPPYGVFQVLCKFLQTQGLSNEILQSSFCGVVVHAVVSYALVFQTPLGYMGAAWATTITLVSLDAILVTIIIKKCVVFFAKGLRLLLQHFLSSHFRVFLGLLPRSSFSPQAIA